jgi:polysaccharide pyruvyl transferase WcaK-like protein
VKRICVWGTSLRKVADEAQVIAFVRIVRQRFPDSQITLFSRYGEAMTALMAREGHTVESFPTWNLRRVVSALARSDLFIIEGGPFYEEFKQACICRLLTAIAQWTGNAVVAYGATAFHFRTWWGRRIYRSLFNRLDAVSVRERTGIEIISELGIDREVQLFADPRFVLDPPPVASTRRLLAAERIDPDEPYVCVTTRFLHPRVPRWVKRSHEYTDERVERSNAVISESISRLANLAQIVVLPMHPTLEEDREMARILRAGMADPARLHLLGRRYGALELLGVVARAELLFASRVGSALFGTIAGTPTLAIAYEPRMSDHMQRMGFGDAVFDWRDLEPERLEASLRQLWSRRDVVGKEMQAAARSFRALAWRNAEILAPYL